MSFFTRANSFIKHANSKFFRRAAKEMPMITKEEAYQKMGAWADKEFQRLADAGVNMKGGASNFAIVRKPSALNRAARIAGRAALIGSIPVAGVVGYGLGERSRRE